VVGHVDQERGKGALEERGAIGIADLGLMGLENGGPGRLISIWMILSRSLPEDSRTDGGTATPEERTWAVLRTSSVTKTGKGGPTCNSLARDQLFSKCRP
jgi:hypothetical protein